MTLRISFSVFVFVRVLFALNLFSLFVYDILGLSDEPKTSIIALTVDHLADKQLKALSLDAIRFLRISIIRLLRTSLIRLRYRRTDAK